ncbi:MAG TPA: GntG family PLP-dependent aldolase [Kofleriaceae bacterium]|nr:GntG family PLP-dependent aldolase [Kofleriaceae bacterium]
MTPPAIDLRSDTVTRPGPGMRQAIAEADVGDDVFGEDPSGLRLEAKVAELLGFPAAMFVPSGTMANQIAINVLTAPGQHMIVGAGAHNWCLEGGAAAALSGVQATVIAGDGRFSGSDLRAEARGGRAHLPTTRLVSVENTHNMGGGLVWERDRLTEVVATARELGLSLHLDGARLWNAAVAQGVSERSLAEGFDTVSVCLSKGLGAPVGSLVAGSEVVIDRARTVRKRLGGGMRQMGILAAAGLYAIDHNRARLADDHENARLMAEILADVPGITVARERVHTNILMIDVESSAPDLARAAEQRGVRVLALSAHRIRAVTHLDVDRQACERAARILAELAPRPAAVAVPG